jgi:hypothetical protein
MQPYFLPYIGYFQLMNAVDKFVIYDDVNYINKGWINRNNILINGKANLFSIPLKDASQNKLINEIYIAEESKWRNKLLKTIELSYKKAPFFEMTYPLVERIINQDASKISDYIYYSISMVNSYLGIKTDIVSSSAQYKNAQYRAQARIIDICLIEGATAYVNPIGGTDLYDKQNFMDRNLEMYFIKPKEISYSQFDNKFIPWLSILDVMMFNSKERIADLLDQCEYL